MKRKLFLTFLIISILAFALAISTSAVVTGSTSSEFGEVTTIPGIDFSTITDKTSRVVLKNADNTYSTYPAYYVVAKVGYFNGYDQPSDMNFGPLNDATGESYDASKIVRLEYPTDAPVIRLPSACKTNIVEIKFPANSQVTTIGSYLFQNYTALEKINIPGSITSFTGANVFSGCSALKEVSFDDDFNLTSLPGQLFVNCTSLEYIVMPNCVESIGSSFTSGCTSLKAIYLSENLTSVGSNAFNVPATTNFYMSAETFASADSVGKGYFYQYNNTAASQSTVYFVGTKAEAEALVKKATYDPIKNASLIEYDMTKPDSYYIPESPTVWTIVYNYNECNAFYGREHNIADEPALTFKDLLTGFHTSAYCERCEMASIVESYGAVFKMHGYSAKIGGDDICVSYAINKTAYEGYKKLTGKDVSFGVVAKVLASNESEAEVLINDNGALSYTGKIINAPVPMGLGSVSFRIKGFSADSSYYALNLVMCAYVFDGEEVDYICYNADGAVSQLATARAVTFSQLATE